MMYKQILLLAIILSLFAGAIEAEIINVPDDERNIQAGINEADDGDTVLVAPGEYGENISFEDKAISIIGNPDDPSEVVIDGDGDASVLTIRGVQEGNCIIAGFTIQNGYDDNGGGIFMSVVNISLHNLIISDNQAIEHGGGIYMTRCAEADIRDVNIINNNSDWDAGGIWILASDNVVMRNLIIEGNSAQNRGGGMYNLGSANLRLINSKIANNSSVQNAGAIYSDDEITLVRSLIVGNSAESVGGAFTGQGGTFSLINCTVANNTAPNGSFFSNRSNSDLSLINCIIWNIGNNPVLTPFREVSVAYTNFENGADVFRRVPDGDINWGEGNINVNPHFVDPENDDYHLVADSPCIDAGDPEYDRDPDGTRIDMGAFASYQEGTIEGYVYDIGNEQPLVGAIVYTSFGTEATTDEDGYWQISPLRQTDYNLTGSMEGYLDSTLFDLEVNIEDTLSYTFSLFHTELVPSIEIISTELLEGESEQFDFNIDNPGNGVLEWSVMTNYHGDADHEPWDLIESHSFGEQLDDSRLYGVVYIEPLFYVAGSNDGNPTIYLINKDGDLIDSFDQPGDSPYGMSDLAWDGEFLWGAIDRTIYGMTLAGEVVASFDVPDNPPTALAWDPDREILWLSTIIDKPVGVDRLGNIVEEVEYAGDLRIYGLAYFVDDPDGANLYIVHKDEDTDRQTLYKHDLEAGENIFVTHLTPEDGGFPQGGFITDQLDHFNWTFMLVSNDLADDRVDIWQIEANTNWALIDPTAGSIDPEGEQGITFIIDATGLAPIAYPAQLTFSHNGLGRETNIPIELTVTSLGVENPDERIAPVVYAITGAYPNPFNSTVRLNYTVPQVSQVSIKLYDITGSLVETVAVGVHQSGQHNLTWNAGSLPSGIYFARLEAVGFSQTVKLMLMK